MNFEKSIEYFIDRIKAKPCWQKIKRIWQESFRVYSAFYCLDLEQGCQVIAFYEALVSLVKICWIYYLVYRSNTRSLFPDPKWIYFMFRGKRHYICYHYTHYQFHVGRYLITILNSTLLFLGVEWSYVVFLYYWIFISLFTWVMALFNAVFDHLLSQIFLFILHTFILECYLILIVTSFIWKISEKSSLRAQEIGEPCLELFES